MFSKPGTPARAREVDELLSNIRQRLVDGDFASIAITLDNKEEPGEDGYTHQSHTGSFTLRAESR